MNFAKYLKIRLYLTFFSRIKQLTRCSSQKIEKQNSRQSLRIPFSSLKPRFDVYQTGHSYSPIPFLHSHRRRGYIQISDTLFPGFLLSKPPCSWVANHPPAYLSITHLSIYLSNYPPIHPPHIHSSILPTTVLSFPNYFYILVLYLRTFNNYLPPTTPNCKIFQRSDLTLPKNFLSYYF